MLSWVQFAALTVVAPALLLPASPDWSAPTELRHLGDYLNGARIAAGADGSALVIWQDSDPNSSTASATGGDFVVRRLAPGGDWGPATVISDGSGYLQPPAAIAMGGDGTAIAAWRQLLSEGRLFKARW